jgi:hypothetical protein
MKIYVSGRIKDYPDYKEHFARAARALEALGHEVVNPCDLVEDGWTYADYMKQDIKDMLECDSVLMLQGWEHSAGARCEFHVAACCGLEIVYENPATFLRKN